jgi:hypothetical protein
MCVKSANFWDMMLYSAVEACWLSKESTAYNLQVEG